MDWVLVVPLWMRLAGLFVLGSIVGSFLNVCIYRLPWGRSIIRPGSCCPQCQRPIAWYDNIPILSWLLLRGRCRHCGAGISLRYPAIELLTGALFAVLYWLEVELRSQVVHGGPELTVTNLHWRYFYHLILVSALIVATFIDLDYQVIPDSVTIPGMLLGLGLGFAIGQVHLMVAWYRPGFTLPVVPPWFVDHPHIHGLIASFAGLVIGGGVVWLVRIIGGLMLRKEAMGFGDVTLMAMIGSFVGWQAAILIFFAAPFFGLLAGGVQWLLYRENRFPYGPYLSLATLGVVMGWRPVWNWLGAVFSLGWILLVALAAGMFLLAGLLGTWRMLWWLAGKLAKGDSGLNSQGPAEEESHL